MTKMTRDDLVRLYTQATDRFRLETLPQYLVPQEVDQLAAWRRGERRLHVPEDTEWLAKIRDETAAGGRWWRVHILDYPLVDYSRWELFAYQANVGAGEQVFIADRAWHADLADLHEDFWLYDSSIAIRMVYDDEGHHLYPEQRDDVQRYLDIRDLAHSHAMPLLDYLHKYEPDLLA
jgi:hypothetical protein